MHAPNERKCGTLRSMKRRSVFSFGAGLAALACGVARSADAAGGAQTEAAEAGFVLITPEQFEAERHEEQRVQNSATTQAPPSRRRGIFPLIRVVAPEASADHLASPLRIELRFETSRDAHIVPATFRVLYGLMKFDLTETMKRNATLTEQGIVVERAAVPQGTHRLLLQIADDRGRVNEQELRLKVAG
jgi:hypothetical protein